MKRVGWLLLISVLAFSLILGGCAKAPETTIDKEAPEAASDKKAPEAPIELTFHYFGPEMIPPGHWSKEAAKRIEEQSNGRVKVKTYFTESLLKYDDTLSGTASGIADISLIDPGLFAGQFDLNNVFSRFEAEIPPQEVTTRAFRELIQTTPELNAELEQKGLRWLSIVAMPGHHVHTTKKPVRVPADIRGMKIAVLGEPARWFQAMGAAPVQVAPGDWYMSLERGLVEGMWSHWAAVNAFKLTDVFNYHTLFGEEGANLSYIGYVINLNKWKTLPPDIQEIIVEAFDWAGDQLVISSRDEISSGIAAGEKKGNTFTKLTPEELRLWAESMKPINDEWEKTTEAKGLPAKKTFAELTRLLEK